MQVSASAYSTETVPLMSLYPEIRETFSTACSFDTFLQFIHATSKLVGDEAGPASGFGSVKQLDDVLSALVATSQDRPAEIWDQCETDCDDSYDESVDCLQKTCNKMIGMQQNALDKISLAIGSCDAGPANVSMALAMSEDVELFGPPVNYHIEGGEWYYTEDVSSSEDDWGECDGVSNDNTHPPVKVKTLAKWVGRRHHPDSATRASPSSPWTPTFRRSRSHRRPPTRRRSPRSRTTLGGTLPSCQLRGLLFGTIRRATSAVAASTATPASAARSWSSRTSTTPRRPI